MKKIDIVSLRMVRERTAEYGAKIDCPAEVYKAVNALFELDQYPHEAMGALFIDNKNKVTAAQVFSMGSLNMSVACPGVVFKSALLANAAAVILFHNHPSGDPAPSKEDLTITQRLKEAGQLLNIRVFDHLIIGDNKYYSMREQGII